MNKLTQKELDKMIAEHKDWLDTDGRFGSRFNASNIQAENLNFNKANLKNAFMHMFHITDSNLECVDLSKAHLSEVIFNKCTLNGTLLMDSSLLTFDITSSTIEASDFSGSYMSDCRFYDSVFNNISFICANLINIQSHGVTFNNTKFSSATFNRCDFKKAKFDRISYNSLPEKIQNTIGYWI